MARRKKFEVLVSKCDKIIKKRDGRGSTYTKAIARQMGITPASLNQKLREPYQFRGVELYWVCEILELEYPEEYHTDLKMFKHYFK